MVQVALIGARGSGKSEFAQLLQEKIGGAIVDDYVERFQEQTNLAVAQYATYVVNMQLAMFRLNNELDATSDEDTVITCGTLLESSIYLAINAANLASGDGDFAANLFNDLRSNATMQWFGMLRTDAWRYDHAFYLPLGDNRNEEQDIIAATVDDHIQEAGEAFRIEYTTLEGDVHQKLEIALEEIEKKAQRSTVN